MGKRSNEVINRELGGSWRTGQRSEVKRGHHHGDSAVTGGHRGQALVEVTLRSSLVCSLTALGITL